MSTAFYLFYMVLLLIFCCMSYYKKNILSLIWWSLFTSLNAIVLLFTVINKKLELLEELIKNTNGL